MCTINSWVYVQLKINIIHSRYTYLLSKLSDFLHGRSIFSSPNCFDINNLNFASIAFVRQRIMTMFAQKIHSNNFFGIDLHRSSFIPLLAVWMGHLFRASTFCLAVWDICVWLRPHGYIRFFTAPRRETESHFIDGRGTDTAGICRAWKTKINSFKVFFCTRQDKISFPIQQWAISILDTIFVTPRDFTWACCSSWCVLDNHLATNYRSGAATHWMEKSKFFFICAQ